MLFSETLVATARHPTSELLSAELKTFHWHRWMWRFCSLYFLTLAPVVSFMFNCFNFSLPELKLHTNISGFRWLSWQPHNHSPACVSWWSVGHSRSLSWLTNSLLKGTVLWRKVVIDTANTPAWKRGFGIPAWAVSHLQQHYVCRCTSFWSSSFLHWLNLPAWIYICKYQRIRLENAISIPPSAFLVQSAATVSKYNSTFQIHFIFSCLFINSWQETTEKENLCIIYHSDKIHPALKSRSFILHSSFKITYFFTLICQKT